MLFFFLVFGAVFGLSFAGGIALIWGFSLWLFVLSYALFGALGALLAGLVIARIAPGQFSEDIDDGAHAPLHEHRFEPKETANGLGEAQLPEPLNAAARKPSDKS